MKTLIDANVILRYILDDDEDMSEKAAIVIQNGAFTLPEIIAEVVYVLSKVYNGLRCPPLLKWGCQSEGGGSLNLPPPARPLKC